MSQFSESPVKLPKSLLEKLYDATGSKSEGTKGFILFFVNEKGEPSMLPKTENTCVKLAIDKMIEAYIDSPI
jgi:hypothetical protein|tara:strand:+ start:1256 stop:1471 length:216 start_codon:yes stop_codon:yes gene_type:complete